MPINAATVQAAAGRIVGKVGHERLATNTSETLGALNLLNDLVERELRNLPGLDEIELRIAIAIRVDELS